MRARRAPFIKFSVDGFRGIFGGDFDAPRAPVTLVRGRQDGCYFGDCIAGLTVSDLHASSPGGRPGTACGRRVQQAGASLCLPVLLVRHPQRFPLGGLPAVWWSWEPRSRFLSIDTYGSSKLSNLGALSQQGCQPTRRRQRRNWRVRAVERGQRSEPARLRAYPGLLYFEPEKPTPTQIPRNVWDTETAGTPDGVNYNSQRNLAKRNLAQSPPDKLRFTHNRKALINIPVTSVASPGCPPGSQFRPGDHLCHSVRKEMP